MADASVWVRRQTAGTFNRISTRFTTIATDEVLAMGVQLSDQDKIDRAAFHEEVRFYKRQQWAVAAAGVALLGAFLATVRDAHMTALGKCLAVVLIAVGLGAGCYFLDSLQEALATVRRRLDRLDREAATRGLDIMHLHKAILVVSALVVVCALFKHGGQADYAGPTEHRVGAEDRWR